MSDIQLRIFRCIRTSTVTTVHSTIEGQHLGVKASNTKFAHMPMSDKANLFLHYPLKLLESIYVSKTNHFIAVSDSIKREIIEHLRVNPNKIETIHNGVNVDRFSPHSRCDEKPSFFPSDRPVILFTGRFVATKGIDVLVKAVPKVLESNPEAFFVFVGGGDWRSYYSYLRSKRVKEQSFLFRGYIEDSDLPRIYSNSTIYVAPTNYEPLGIRILEAMSCGVPVIASRVGGIPEIIEDYKNGLLISPSNPESLAERIMQLLGDNDLAKYLGINARKRILEQFSDEKMTEKTLDCYKQILNSN